MNAMKPLNSNPELRLLFASYTARALPQDYVLFSDDLMDSVLKGELHFTRQQFNALVKSPLTLCRLRFLEGTRLTAQATEKLGLSTSGTVPLRWKGSFTELLAASDPETDCTLVSQDGMWALHALTTRGVTRLKLQLLLGAEDDSAAGLAPLSGSRVEVLDGHGGSLMTGTLDAEGEIEVLWSHAEDLRTYLAHHGGSWSVRPA